MELDLEFEVILLFCHEKAVMRLLLNCCLMYLLQHNLHSLLTLEKFIESWMGDKLLRNAGLIIAWATAESDGKWQFIHSKFILDSQESP